MAKVLCEFIGLNYDQTLVKEAKEKNLPVVLQGVLQRADARNQNGRVYPRHILEREITNYQKAVAEGRAVGEADHPDHSVVSLKNVSHVVREIGWNGNDVVGKVEILNTPSGNILKNLMESGIRLGISSRGVGEVRRDDEGNDVVDESFVLICFDVVSEPSTHGAWLGESKNVNINDVVSKLSKRDRVNRIVNEILKKTSKRLS
jgi:hypothetical protein